ncbi:glucose-fructose oxidoreductase domain-containing protein 1-like [Lampetra fluviatilis]
MDICSLGIATSIHAYEVLKRKRTVICASAGIAAPAATDEELWGVFNMGLTARLLVSLLLTNGFSVEALLGRTRSEAEQLTAKMRIHFSSSSCMGGVPLHQLVDLMRIFNPPELSCQIAVKTLG